MSLLVSRILAAICMVLAVACTAYAFAVLHTHSGTGFWAVWLVFALLFILLGLSFLFRWWSLMPRVARNVIIAVVVLALACFGAVEARIIGAMTSTAQPGLDYVIVLGAQVRTNGPSRVLRYRLDTAVDYLNASPRTICIVSGGQGPNEPFPEAQGMAAYLQEHGIAGDRILQERRSTTTEENIRFSRRLIAGAAADSGTADAAATGAAGTGTAAPGGTDVGTVNTDTVSVGLITNNFHMFRALQIARSQGLPQAQGIAAGSPPDMLVNNMVREFFAEVKYLAGSLGR